MSDVIGAKSDRHHQQMSVLADITGCDVTYKDLGNGEDYVLWKDGRSVTLQIRGNRVDGGFMSIEGKGSPEALKGMSELTLSPGSM
jgi:hypothetical protein